MKTLAWDAWCAALGPEHAHYRDAFESWWRERDECADGHDTGEMLWSGTSHQGVVCRRCKVFLPC